MGKLRSYLLWQHSLPLIAAALLVGWLGHSYYARSHDQGGAVVQMRENSDDYKFISPLILVKDSRDLHFEKYDGLKSAVQKYIKNSLKDNEAERISFYFRDLNSNEWVGVNEEDKFAPASLLKVATLMAYLKLADKDQRILLASAHYEPSSLEGQYYPPKQLKAGDYSVKILLQQMIKQSDNDAMRALHSLYAEELIKIYQDLDLPDPFSDTIGTDFLSPREYSRFFRTFYNGSYISHLYSDEALGLLAATEFKQGLAKAVPTGVDLAHKFGEYTFADHSHRELHDCGIIYYPTKPYFVCVMTEGQNFDQLANIIQEISKIVYEQVKIE